LTKACPCCVETSSPAAVRKRLASHLDDDDESTVTGRKRVRQGVDPSARLADGSRSCANQVVEMCDSAGKVDKTAASFVTSNVATEVVKRGRGRPRKVSCRHFVVQLTVTWIAFIYSSC